MSSDVNRFTLRFSKNSAEQQMAYKILSSIPAGKRTDFICGIINKHVLNQQLDDMIYRAVKRAMNENPAVAWAAPQKQQKKHKEGEIREDIMDFLKSL